MVGVRLPGGRLARGSKENRVAVDVSVAIDASAARGNAARTADHAASSLAPLTGSAVVTAQSVAKFTNIRLQTGWRCRPTIRRNLRDAGILALPPGRQRGKRGNPVP